MRVLIVGSGTKEYSLAKSFAALKNVDMVFVAPGNEHIKDVANCIDIASDNIPEILEFAQANEISLTLTFDEKAIAGAVNMGVTKLYSLFKLYTDITPYEYYLNCKIEHIKEKLKEKNLSVKEAFAACGENSQGRIARVFKKITGLSPSQFREKLR